MASLLRWHRIQQRLGGPGSHTVPVTTTPAERERMGQIIQRYRLAALTWCSQAVTAVTPRAEWSRTTGPARTPAEELRTHLDTAITALGHGERLSDLLAVHHDNHLLDSWQWVARAAALGEHDFASGVNRDSLTPEQARTVLKDAADLTQGLVILDSRYKNVPAWQHLNQPVRLGRAAEAVSLTADQNGYDTTVDTRGWRPPAGLINGPALPGLAGAVQAQHNTLVHLSALPNALNLRRILHSQARVTQEAAKHAATATPDLFQEFSHRAVLYRNMVTASRDLRGLIGAGGHAVVESQNAATRLQRVHPMLGAGRKPLEDLHRLFKRTDARIAATVERGIHEKLYLASASHDQLAEDPIRGIHPARREWKPVTSPVQTPLLRLVRERLRPIAVPQSEPDTSDAGRMDFASALAHHPQPGRGRAP
ncbi:hypothetical protein G7072_08570 [Nocardioides sp. HDW12B]|uniref:hypothetical protein n=1 Tax=Nocardioides sp. HDW12B TaxID=2714939 RepID=UPI00140D6AFB|nr:hypothetical protein [Nocardioides sp. HDW12B]QIK66404.1 hypothetical protein G7072_08570 [Nocardioides sp. HDW12B]